LKRECVRPAAVPSFDQARRRISSIRSSIALRSRARASSGLLPWTVITLQPEISNRNRANSEALHRAGIAQVPEEDPTNKATWIVFRAVPELIAWDRRPEVIIVSG
jgi:hypothetical protein